MSFPSFASFAVQDFLTLIAGSIPCMIASQLTPSPIQITASVTAASVGCREEKSIYAG